MKHLLIAAVTLLSGIIMLVSLEDHMSISKDTLQILGFIWGLSLPLILNVWLLEKENKSSKTEK
jgi:hypothetical protein